MKIGVNPYYLNGFNVSEELKLEFVKKKRVSFEGQMR